MRNVAEMANRKKDKTLVRVTVCLDPDAYAKFETLSEEEGLSTAWFIRRAMRDFLDEKKYEESNKSLSQ